MSGTDDLLKALGKAKQHNSQFLGKLNMKVVRVNKPMNQFPHAQETNQSQGPSNPGNAPFARSFSSTPHYANSQDYGDEISFADNSGAQFGQSLSNESKAPSNPINGTSLMESLMSFNVPSIPMQPQVNVDDDSNKELKGRIARLETENSELKVELGEMKKKYTASEYMADAMTLQLQNNTTAQTERDQLKEKLYCKQEEMDRCQQECRKVKVELKNQKEINDRCTALLHDASNDATALKRQIAELTKQRDQKHASDSTSTYASATSQRMPKQGASFQSSVPFSNLMSRSIFSSPFASQMRFNVKSVNVPLPPAQHFNFTMPPPTNNVPPSHHQANKKRFNSDNDQSTESKHPRYPW